MPMMVASAINQVFAMAGGVAFPYAYYLLAFVASTALALIARTLTERFIKNFVLLHGAAGFSPAGKLAQFLQQTRPRRDLQPFHQLADGRRPEDRTG